MPIDPKTIQISNYDSRQLDSLAIEAVDDLQIFGSSNRGVKRALEEAFRLGFTAVYRGESGQPHPEPTTELLAGE